MIELRFHADFYPPDAVSDAVTAYGEHARCDVQRRDDATWVRVTAVGDTDEKTLAAELANYVLGLSIERRRAR